MVLPRGHPFWEDTAHIKLYLRMKTALRRASSPSTCHTYSSPTPSPNAGTSWDDRRGMFCFWPHGTSPGSRRAEYMYFTAHHAQREVYVLHTRACGLLELCAYITSTYCRSTPLDALGVVAPAERIVRHIHVLDEDAKSADGSIFCVPNVTNRNRQRRAKVIALLLPCSEVDGR